MSVFTGECWRCWPASCRCPAAPDEADQMKGDLFLLDRELQRENRRAREFGDSLKHLANAVIKARDTRLADGGLDNVPPDLHDLFLQAQTELAILDESRNQDRMTELYRKMHPRTDGGGRG